MFVVRLSILLLAYVVSGCSAGQPVVEKDAVQTAVGQAIGTTWTVKWIGRSGDAEAVRAVVEVELARLDQKMSTWRPDSELSQLRGKRGAHEVSKETAEVVEAALSLAADTNGAFDPTVGPLMELWGFKGNPRQTLPTDEEIAAVMRTVGHERVQMGRAEGKWRLDTLGSELDLSAIAKGTGVDWISRALIRKNFADHMVEVGGEMRVSGGGPKGTGWSVGVDDPRVAVNERKLAIVLRLNGRSVATSGNYRNRYVVGAQTVFHTFDPRTGRPAETSVLSATVISANCQMADGAATALMVMQYDEGRKWVDRHPDLEAGWIVQRGDQWVLEQSEGFTPFVEYVAAPFASQ